MIVLAVDTATPQVSVALAGPAGPLASIAIAEGRRHGEVLAPAIRSLCGYARVTLGEVDLVAVDVGPGLFTGLRVGLATARALASALAVPAVGLRSTEILAAAHADAGRSVAAVVDVRRGEVAWALYRPSPSGMVEVVAPTIASPPELRQALVPAVASDPAPVVLAVGDGARRYAAQLEGVDVSGTTAPFPSAAVLAELAAGRVGEAGDASSLLPLYLRDADVRIGWEQAAVRG